MKMINKRRVAIISASLAIIIFLFFKTFSVFAFHNPQELLKDPDQKISSLYYDSEENNNEQLVAFRKLTGITTLSKIHIKDNGNFTIKYDSKILSGKLNIYVVDKNNNIIKEISSNNSGSMVINSNGNYDFSIKIYAKNAKGTIELKIIPQDNLDIKYNNEISDS
ncbi:hypothetical protein K5V21_10890 [Clostridium sardiniense]|uniref:NEAT domain-containing protein n=1 Tax=Clostridium sardiniense TaxID=29369 RepID=A0ABS7KYR7_CLOSR|nr:hypothetical protein [Clostridium sardiniense]MBY0755953.1 hypothetical protein [Clostridium sardiniense]MDQ0460757.1 hypothetical protein [Clostridium sardiniense]